MVTGGSQTSHTETTLQLTKNVRIGSKMSEHFREGDGRDTTLFLIAAIASTPCVFIKTHSK